MTVIDKVFEKTSPGEEKATKDDAAADGAKLPDDGKVEEGEGGCMMAASALVFPTSCCL